MTNPNHERSRALRNDLLALQGDLSKRPAYQLAAKQALVHYRSGAVFSFIPKNACTTLRLSLAPANGFLSDKSQWRWMNGNSGMLTATAREIASATHSFVIMRCPYRRLVSAFLDKIVDRRPPFWTLRTGRIDDVPIYEMTFRQFARLMQKPMARDCDYHWRPQSHLLIYQRYDHYLAMENMAHARSVIEAETGLELVDARELTDHGTDTMTKIDSPDVADMPIHDLAGLKRRGHVPTYQSFFDDEIIGWINTAFAADIQLYKREIGASSLLFS